MLHSLESGLQTDDSKISVINDKLNKIDETRRTLQGEVESSDDEELPKYEDEDSDDEPETKREECPQVHPEAQHQKGCVCQRHSSE